MRIQTRTMDSSSRLTNLEHYDKQRSGKPTAVSTTCDSRHLRRVLSSKRCTRIPLIIAELKRELWTATVTYVFRENVKNNELAVNPLGLTIVRFRADQAFS